MAVGKVGLKRRWEVGEMRLVLDDYKEKVTETYEH
jgi:hypothetical protein